MTSYLNNGYYDQKKFTTTLPVGSYSGFFENQDISELWFHGTQTVSVCTLHENSMMNRLIIERSIHKFHNDMILVRPFRELWKLLVENNN